MKHCFFRWLATLNIRLLRKAMQSWEILFWGPRLSFSAKCISYLRWCAVSGNQPFLWATFHLWVNLWPRVITLYQCVLKSQHILLRWTSVTQESVELCFWGGDRAATGREPLVLFLLGVLCFSLLTAAIAPPPVSCPPQVKVTKELYEGGKKRAIFKPSRWLLRICQV